MEKKKNEIIEKIDQTFEVKQKMPKTQKEKIYKRIFQDILLAIGISIYFIFLNLGFKNIAEEVFAIDLKVFSISILIIAIIFFEYSYKHNKGKTAIYGIEILVLAISTLAASYLLEIYKNSFSIVICIFSLIFLIYYVIKSIRVYKKMKKEYYESLSDIKEIIKKESVQEKNG